MERLSGMIYSSSCAVVFSFAPFYFPIAALILHFPIRFSFASMILPMLCLDVFSSVAVASFDFAGVI